MNRFNYRVLEFCALDKLIKLEQKYLDILVDKYNLCPTAGSTLGRRHTAESKLKMSESSLQRSGGGKKFSAETLLKLRNRRASPETIEKFKARRHTEETKRKIGASSLGLKRSEESKARYRAAALLRESKNIHYKAKCLIITDLQTNETTEYRSIGKAALAITGSKSG